MIFGGNSHVGLKRKLNEDFFLIDELLKLAIVCDGMGGHEMGDLASRSIAKNVASFFSRLTENDMNQLDTHFADSPQLVIKRIFYAIQLANLQLLHIAEEHRVKKGMGTTIVGLHVFRDSIIIFHVGDSRCYRLQNNTFQCLTKDHSFAQNLYDRGEISFDEYKNFDNKNVITRALGMGPTVKVDIAQYTLRKDDIFLLCTDGLWGLVDDQALHTQISENLKNLKDLPDALIDLANSAGGDDNITSLFMRNDASFSIESETQSAHYSLSIQQSDIPNYEAILKRYFTNKKISKKQYVVATTGLFVILLVSFLLLHFQGVNIKHNTIENLPISDQSEKKKLSDQTVYFYLDAGSIREWRNAEVIIEDETVGLLYELENGFRIQPGRYHFSLVLNDYIIYQDNFECVVDPTGERNLIEIKSD
ncbi:serine/threonine-protein phosphatase [candidate division KSB1 bacterium]|nr:serine/threonine-protein phosphatase [candidate division KSB1 bacterium]